MSLITNGWIEEDSSFLGPEKASKLKGDEVKRAAQEKQAMQRYIYINLIAWFLVTKCDCLFVLEQPR